MPNKFKLLLGFTLGSTYAALWIQSAEIAWCLTIGAIVAFAVQLHINERIKF